MSFFPLAKIILLNLFRDDHFNLNFELRFHKYHLFYFLMDPDDHCFIASLYLKCCSHLVVSFRYFFALATAD